MYKITNIVHKIIPYFIPSLSVSFNKIVKFMVYSPSDGIHVSCMSMSKEMNGLISFIIIFDFIFVNIFIYVSIFIIS